MNLLKLVSVVIPFYKNTDWLIEAINSILHQTYKNIEIIVINDGSPEDDKGFISKYRDSVIYIKSKNRGPGVARNLGIDMANGEYIAFLDSDDVWLPQKIERQVFLMEKEKAIWSHTSYYRFYEKKQRKDQLIDVGSFQGNIYPKCLIRSPIATPCVMIRKDFLEKHAFIRFSEDMRFGQDSFMWLNMARKAPLFVIAEPLVKVRIRGTNAGLRARVKLQSKSKIWKFLKESLQQGDNKLPKSLKLIYGYCYLANTIVNKIEYSFVKDKGWIEFISKMLYMPAFISIRAIALKNFNN